MKKTATFVLFGLLLFTSAALAGPIDKVGYIDFAKVFELYSNTKPEVKNYLSKQDEIKMKVTNMEKELESLYKDLQDKGMLYSNETKSKKQEELNQKYTEYQNFKNMKTQELMDQGNTLTQALTDEIQKVVEQIGQDGGYSLILKKSNILYGSPEMDLTDILLQKLNLKDSTK